MCESLVLGFVQDCGIHIFTGWSIRCTKNVLKRQKRDAVKSSVFSMDGDRSILHLHGNTVCRHLPVISCIGQMIVVRNVCGLVQYVNEWSYCLAGFCSVLLHA